MSKNATSSGQALPPRERSPPPYAQAQQTAAGLAHTRRRQSYDGAASLPPHSAAHTGSGFKKLLHTVGDHTLRPGRRVSVESAKHALGGLFRRSSRGSIQEDAPDQSSPLRHNEQSNDGSNRQTGAYLEVDTDSSDGNKKDTREQDDVDEQVAHKSNARLASASFLDSDTSEDADDESAAATGLGRGTTFTAEYEAEPAPGNWGRPQGQSAITNLGRPNVPLEPEEHAEVSVPWF
ncbi:hypothetical protein GGI00_004019, partial [Coemansia sp. RSA 2681]